MIVLGCDGGERFADNTKYQFLHYHNNVEEVRPIWVTKDSTVLSELRDAKYEVYPYNSWRGRYVTLRAGTVMISHLLRDVPWWATGGADVVQLWHGNPLKTIGWQRVKSSRLIDRLLYKYVFGRFTYIIVTGERPISIFEEAFRCSREELLVCGYPRNDRLFRDIKGSTLCQPSALTRIEQIPSNSIIITYLPTFRDQTSISPLERIDLDFTTLQEFLEEEGAYFLYKPHVLSTMSVERDYDNILQLPPDLDIYEILPQTDVLMTDYSSVLFDFLLLDQPIVFFAPDLSEYRTERTLYYDYERLVPGPIARSNEEFFRALSQAMNGGDGHSKDRKILCHQFFKHTDGNSGQRVERDIRELDRS